MKSSSLFISATVMSPGKTVKPVFASGTQETGPGKYNVTINGTNIPFKLTVKLLGVIFNQLFTFRQHAPNTSMSSRNKVLIYFAGSK